MMASSPRDVRVKIWFFAKARELTGVHDGTIVLSNVISYVNLVEEVVKRFHLESICENLILALNSEFISTDSVINLSEGDELAVIPPLSGG